MGEPEFGAPPPPIASSVFGGNSFRLVDDLLFILQSQRLGAAVGEIDDQIVVPSHDAWEEKSLYALGFELVGKIHIHGSSQIMFGESRPL